MAVFWSIFGVVVVVVLGVIGFIIGIYNNLVTLKNYALNVFAQIDVQLKRRYDLIPNIVEIAKKYLSHEQETLSKVIQARNIAKNDNVTSFNIYKQAFPNNILLTQKQVLVLICFSCLVVQ